MNPALRFHFLNLYGFNHNPPCKRGSRWTLEADGDCFCAANKYSAICSGPGFALTAITVIDAVPGARQGSPMPRLGCVEHKWLFSILFSLATVVLSHSPPRAHAADWPQLLGPTGDAVYGGSDLATNWPTAGPPIVWQVPVGEGYSSPVVGEGALVICHRKGNELWVERRNPQDGTVVWSFQRPMKFQDGAYMDSGPRPTPAIRDGRVYVHNSDGYLVCLGLKDGAKIWSRDARKDFSSSATWHGNIASPCVTAKHVILPVGGTNDAGIVGFSRETGETAWQTTSEKASGVTPRGSGDPGTPPGTGRHAQRLAWDRSGDGRGPLVIADAETKFGKHLRRQSCRHWRSDPVVWMV
jgi:hypothetical protein